MFSLHHNVANNFDPVNRGKQVSSINATAAGVPPAYSPDIKIQIEWQIRSFTDILFPIYKTGDILTMAEIDESQIKKQASNRSSPAKEPFNEDMLPYIVFISKENEGEFTELEFVGRPDLKEMDI